MDLEKSISDTDTDSRRIKTKNATLMTQLVELETELTMRGLLTDELRQQFEAVHDQVYGV